MHLHRVLRWLENPVDYGLLVIAIIANILLLIWLLKGGGAS